MSSRSQQRNNATDAVTTQCIERISALDQKLTSTNSELIHHKETLQLEIRDKTKDVLNEAKKDINNLKVNYDNEFASLRNSFNKDNESLTKKMEKKFKETEELMESRDTESKKYAEKLFNEHQSKIRELNIKIDKEVLELREMVINEVSSLKGQLETSRKEFKALQNLLEDLKSQLSKEEAARLGVRNELDNESSKLNAAINNLQKYIDKLSSEKRLEIEQLTSRSNGFASDFTNWETKQKQISRTLKESNTKRDELGNDIENLHNDIKKLSEFVHSKFEEIPDKIDEKFQQHSIDYRDMHDELKKENAEKCETVKKAVEKVNEELSGKYSDNLEATRKIAESVSF
uniref:SWI5-dependent HO expression protein 3 n=1 Tax=Panagrolaimus davidi TaxID=227884 RepID=A0A914P5D9_9BILA